MLLEIQTNPKISRNKLAIKLGISSDTIKEYIEKLKSKSAIRRVGKTSAGYWEILGRTSTPQDTLQDTPQVELTELEKKMLLEIQTNPKISRNDLAIKLGISSDTVKEYIEKLKSKDAIRRIGKTSAGYWEILR